MTIVTDKQWLALPWIVRWWRVKFCEHSFNESRKVGAVYEPQRDWMEYRYVVNVRQCGRCPAYFLDHGYERDPSKAHIRRARLYLPMVRSS